MILTLIMAALVASAWAAVTVLPTMAAGAARRMVAGVHAQLDRSDSLLSRVVPRAWSTSILELPLLTLLAVPLILGVWAFFGILHDVGEGDRIVDLDKALFQFLQHLRTAPFDAVMIAITGMGDHTVVMPVAAAGLIGLAALQRWRAALYLLVATGGAVAFVGGVKRFIQRPRPISIYDGLAEYSFPSGHASMSVVLYGFLAVLLAQGAPPAWRRIIAFATLLLIGLIALSRVYLGAHWLTDVLAGLAFGIAWIALLTIGYLRHHPQPVPAAAFGALLLAVMVLADGRHIIRDGAHEAARYTVKAHPQPTRP